MLSNDKINELKKYALGDDDIEYILGKDIFIFVYPYLEDVKHIDEVFDKKGRSLMLFLTEDQNTGHWICMIKKKNKIYYFDPYGNKPDEDLKWLSKAKKEMLDQENPILTRLLKDSGYEVYYNLYPYQTEAYHINTCGRWCAYRLLKKDLTDAQFNKLIKENMKKYNLSSDGVITLLTYNLLKK